ncbi:hypothetical protein P22_1181 [Propionispora sp. 2/2-37]|nr:hypothetical protein P22_1181 [Propionispora sp. 2/2-37]
MDNLSCPNGTLPESSQVLQPNKRTPKVFLRIITMVSTLGGLLFGYNTGVVNGALVYMARPDQLNLTPFMEGVWA